MGSERMLAQYCGWTDVDENELAIKIIYIIIYNKVFREKFVKLKNGARKILPNFKKIVKEFLTEKIEMLKFLKIKRSFFLHNLL